MLVLDDMVSTLQLAAFERPPCCDDRHRSAMQLSDCLRPQLTRQTPHGFVVRDLATANAGELSSKGWPNFPGNIFKAQPRM